MKNRCFMRRIWANKISLFVPRPRDVPHPSSGPAQDWLRICSGLLTLRTIPGRLRHNMLNSNRASLEVVPHIKWLNWFPSFESEWFCLLAFKGFATAE